MFPTPCTATSRRQSAFRLCAAVLASLIATCASAQSSSTAQAYVAASPHGLDPRKPAPASAGAMTLQQVVDLAKTKNPTLLAARENLSAVRAQEIQAALRVNPTFNLNGTNLTEDEHKNNPYNYAAQVSRLFERGGKRGLRIDVAKATTAQTQAQLEDSIRQTMLQLKTAFTQMLIAKQALALSTATLKDFRHEVEIAHERYKLGDLGKLDYLRLDLQLGSFESDEANNIVNLRQASDQLQTLMGIEVPKEDFDITGDVVPPNVTQSKDTLTQLALASRPDYAAARLGVTAAQANAKLVSAQALTDPTLEAEYDRAGTENSYGLSVSVPLRIFDRNQGNKETARFQTSSARFAETAAKNQVVSEVDQAWVNYVQSKRLSDRFGEHYLDESHEVLSIAQYAFEHGGIALIDYLDALRDCRSSNSDALNAYQQTWLAIHQLSASAATELTP